MTITRIAGTSSTTFRTGGPAGPGVSANGGYATATGVVLPNDGSAITLASLVVAVPAAGMAVDVLYSLTVTGNGAPGSEVEFVCRVDGAAINDNGSGNLLDETVPYTSFGGDESAPWGGPYMRMARIVGLAPGNHTVDIQASTHLLAPTMNNVSIQASLVVL